MPKVIKEVIHANGINIGIYTEDFQNEYISITTSTFNIEDSSATNFTPYPNAPIGIYPSDIDLLSDFVKNMSDRFLTSTIPSSFISKTPISLVEPNLFFTPLTIL